MLVQMTGDDDPAPDTVYRQLPGGFHVDDDPRVIGLDLDDTEIRVFADEPVWSVPSVFGTPLTARQELEVIEVTSTWGYDKFDPLDLVHRDEELVRAAGRWHGTPLAPRHPDRFPPGDVAAIRYAAVQDDLIRQVVESENSPDPLKRAPRLAATAMRWLYAATPYYVDLSTLVGLVDCELPASGDLDDIRLPHRAVAVYFGGDIAIPMNLIEADQALRLTDMHYSSAIGSHPEWVSADEALPHRVSGPTVAIWRNQLVQICGLVFHADPDGRLDDHIMWLTVTPEQTRAPRRAIYGHIQRSTLRYVAINLAAAVAWGQWTPPSEPLALPSDPKSRAFRDATRTGAFRRREPHGNAVDIRVLDTKRTSRSPHATPEATHASPITHLRKRHWQRYRLGPRDNWHYERRLLDPIVVNPGHEPERTLTIYRLPPPP
jgi:hypothetical protein